ncbi:MAG: hypothetical protein LLG06_07100, partial [Desulfobacteraceae bacterium]|nr:hypothetical protein [Desulfobacteraceae bacterium]
LGIEVRFDSLNISPGKGSALGTGRGRIFIGLPGNPWAARIVYEEVAAPMIRRFQGIRRAEFSFQARTRRALKNEKGQFRAFGGMIREEANGYEFVAGGDAGRGGLPLFRNGLSYALLHPQEKNVAAGETVRVKVPDLPLSAWPVLNM